MARRLHQSPLHRIAMHVPQILHALKEAVAAARRTEKRQSPVARPGDRVQVRCSVSAMQSAGPHHTYGMGSIVPAIAKSARTAKPQFRNGEAKTRTESPGHPP